MGTFTKKNMAWELLNSWWLFMQVLSFGVLSFVGFLYVGLLGNRTKWIWIGVLSIAVIPAAFLTKSFIFTPVILLMNWGASIAYSFFINKEFLRRLEAISNGFSVPSNAKYTGQQTIHIKAKEVISDVNSMNQLPQESSKEGQQFIMNLKKWEAAIESGKLKNNIKELILISQQIEKKQSNESAKFFMRYADPVNTLLSKYDQIENARLNTEQAAKSMLEVENFIEKIVKVFEKEFADLYKNDLLDMDTEVEAFTQSLKNRGLLDDEIQQPIKNTNT